MPSLPGNDRDFEPAVPLIGKPRLPRGRTINLPGRGTTFIREVAGPPGAPTVILLHGWTVTAALNWCGVFEPLADHVNVVAIDNRGHGRGIRSRRRFRLEDAADDAVALADARGIDTFVAAGYSMGGPIAQLAWRRHRTRVSGLVLAATFARQPTSRAESATLRTIGLIGRASRLATRKLRLDLITRAAAKDPATLTRPAWMLSEVRTGSVPMMLEAARAIARFDSRRWIGEVDVPTGVLTTDLDEIVPPDRQHRLAALLPHAEIRHVPTGHDGCVVEAHKFAGPFIELVRHAAGLPQLPQT